MTESKFVYVTYIRTTAEKLWDALTNPQVTPKFWFGVHQDSDWKVGSAWRLIFADGRVADAGEVLEIDPPRRLVVKWRNEFKPELKAEGWSRCVFEIEQGTQVVKLSITHSIEREHAKFIEAVAGGWPKILSSLKTLLETGEVLPEV